MFCRKCGMRLTADLDRCPRCDQILAQVTGGVLKTSTILISADQTEAVFHSIYDLPENLRKRFLDSTTGLDATTVLIADRRGKEELAKAIRKLPPRNQRRLLPLIMGGDSGASASRSLFHMSVPQLVGMLLAGTAGVLVWLILSHNW